MIKVAALKSHFKIIDDLKNKEVFLVEDALSLAQAQWFVLETLQEVESFKIDQSSYASEEDRQAVFLIEDECLSYIELSKDVFDNVLEKISFEKKKLNQVLSELLIDLAKAQIEVNVKKTNQIQFLLSFFQVIFSNSLPQINSKAQPITDDSNQSTQHLEEFTQEKKTEKKKNALVNLVRSGYSKGDFAIKNLFVKN